MFLQKTSCALNLSKVINVSSEEQLVNAQELKPLELWRPQLPLPVISTKEGLMTRQTGTDKIPWEYSRELVNLIMLVTCNGNETKWSTQSHIAVKCISGENLTGNRSCWWTGGFADAGSWLAISRGSSHIVTRPGQHTKSYWTWPIEIVDLIYPLKMVIFHSYVSLPEGIGSVWCTKVWGWFWPMAIFFFRLILHLDSGWNLKLPLNH